jgi:hypothetical protein
MLKNPLPVTQLPAAYSAYSWDAKHGLYGYPPDSFPNFCWIRSLERRFAWVRSRAGRPSGPSLFKEMLQWGGSQNGVLQKFDDGVDEVCFADSFRSVISNLSLPAKAIESALRIPGLGLTYASKLLRFLDPERYGALDGRIRKGLGAQEWVNSYGDEIRIHDSSVPSMVNGYCLYLIELTDLKFRLEESSIPCPRSEINDTGTWRLADIEMALFQHLMSTVPLKQLLPIKIESSLTVRP